jgi:hypothetical protein
VRDWAGLIARVFRGTRRRGWRLLGVSRALRRISINRLFSARTERSPCRRSRKRFCRSKVAPTSLASPEADGLDRYWWIILAGMVLLVGGGGGGGSD